MQHSASTYDYEHDASVEEDDYIQNRALAIYSDFKDKGYNGLSLGDFVAEMDADEELNALSIFLTEMFQTGGKSRAAWEDFDALIWNRCQKMAEAELSAPDNYCYD